MPPQSQQTPISEQLDKERRWHVRTGHYILKAKQKDSSKDLCLHKVTAVLPAHKRQLLTCNKETKLLVFLTQMTHTYGTKSAEASQMYTTIRKQDDNGWALLKMKGEKKVSARLLGYLLRSRVHASRTSSTTCTFFSAMHELIKRRDRQPPPLPALPSPSEWHFAIHQTGEPWPTGALPSNKPNVTGTFRHFLVTAQSHFSASFNHGQIFTVHVE